MTTILPKAKHRAVKHSKSTTAQDRGGHSGNGPKPARYLKKHMRASGLPGTPRGVCVAIKGNKDCNCGKHHA